MRSVPLRSVVDEFWRLVGQGWSAREAGVAVGVSASAGHGWFAAVGGVKPRSVSPGPRRRPRLSFEEREEIALRVAAGEAVREIARRLGRAPSVDDLAGNQEQQCVRPQSLPAAVPVRRPLARRAATPATL